MMKSFLLPLFLSLFICGQAQPIVFDMSKPSENNLKGGETVCIDGKHIIAVGTTTDNMLAYRSGEINKPPGKYESYSLTPAPDMSDNLHKIIPMKDCYIIVYRVANRKQKSSLTITGGTIVTTEFYVKLEPDLKIYAAKFSAEGKLLKNTLLVEEEMPQGVKPYRKSTIRFAVSEDKTQFAVLWTSIIKPDLNYEVDYFDEDFKSLGSSVFDNETLIAASADPGAKNLKVSDFALGNNKQCYFSFIATSSRKAKKAGLAYYHSELVAIVGQTIKTAVLKSGKKDVISCGLKYSKGSIYAAVMLGDKINNYHFGHYVFRFSKDLELEHAYKPTRYKRNGEVILMMGTSLFDFDVLPNKTVMLFATQSGGLPYNPQYCGVHVYKCSEDSTKNYESTVGIFQAYSSKDDYASSCLRYQIIGEQVAIYYNQPYNLTKSIETPQKNHKLFVLASDYSMQNCQTWVARIDVNGKVISDQRLMKDTYDGRLFTKTAYKDESTGILYFFGEKDGGAIVARSVFK